MDDRREMSQIDPADLWMERDMSYGFVVRKMVASANAAAAAAEAAVTHSGHDHEIDEEYAADWADVAGVQFGDISSISTSVGVSNNRNWADLEVFESGDAASDEPAWDMVVQALDKQSGPVKWWKVQERGKIVHVKQ